MLNKLRCYFGFHVWKYGPPNGFVEARRNLSYYDEVSKTHVQKEGPLERFYVDPHGVIKPYRDCLNCQKRQVNFNSQGWI